MLLRFEHAAIHCCSLSIIAFEHYYEHPTGGRRLSSADVIIIGGGVTGAAVGLGLLEEGAEKVLIFDEQLPSQRLSRGNFGFDVVHVQGRQ